MIACRVGVVHERGEGGRRALWPVRRRRESGGQGFERHGPVQDALDDGEQRGHLVNGAHGPVALEKEVAEESGLHVGVAEVIWRCVIQHAERRLVASSPRARWARLEPADQRAGYVVT
eukprot:4697634-Prymnesium_polylepis.1